MGEHFQIAIEGKKVNNVILVDVEKTKNVQDNKICLFS